MSDKPIDADCAGKLTILPGERVDELQQAGLRILQKEQGFRFGMDAVLLSSFVRAESRDRCADFGTGTGILPLLLAGMGRAKSVDAFEIQPDMADMARRSVRLNGLEHIIRIHALPVESADEVLAPGSIDVIVCNPPYGHHGTTLPNPAQTLSLARHQQKSGLTAWFKMAYHLLRGKGRMAVIYPAARMLEVMKDMEKAGLAPKRFQLIYPSAQKAANLVMIEALKDARPMLHPEPPLMIYEPDGTLTAPLRKIYAMERASGVHAGDGEIQHARERHPQQVRHEQRAEKAPRHLRHLHAVVEFQLDGERADKHDENKTLHHVGQVERQHGKMTDRETERHKHREQQLEPVVHELRRAEHLTGRDDA
mgnify:FL=1